MTTQNETTDESQAENKMGSKTKLAVDLGPLVIFFLAYQQYGIMIATSVLMVGIVIAQAYAFSIEKRIAPMPLITGIFVLFFGGLTLLLNDELFIKLKPTIVNLLFAGILLTGQLMGRPFVRFLLQDTMPLTDEGWRKLTYRFIGFFLFLALVNEIVWRNFSTDFWVAFKVWGNIPITFIFFATLVPLVMKYQLPEDQSPETK